MTSRIRIQPTCEHREPDRLTVDFGGGFQTGIHVSVVCQLRQALGLDTPGTPVKVVEPYQMLGESAPDLGDFTLRSDSIVFKEIPGFQPIPFEKMQRKGQK